MSSPRQPAGDSAREKTNPIDVFAAIAPSAIAWLLIFWSIPPAQQQFPLSDDAAYNASVRALLEGRGIHYFDWAFMPQLGHWLWALPFVKLFGATYAATRMSTIAISLAGIAAFYFLLRDEVRAGRVASMFACWLLAVNPLFFILTGTFMTDIPTISFSLIALAAFSVGLHRNSRVSIIIGALAAVMAVSTRQNAFAVPVVMAFLVWQRAGNPRARNVLWGVVAIVVITGVVIEAWFTRRNDVMIFSPQFPPLDHVARVSASIAIYMGLFVSPCALIALGDSASRIRTRWLFAAAGFVLMWLAYVRAVMHQPFETGLFPTSGNSLTPYGAFGYGYMLGSPQLLMPLPVRLALTLLAGVGLAWLLQQAARWWASRASIDAMIVYGVMNLPFMFISSYLFDRYLLVFLPSALALAIRGIGDYLDKRRTAAIGAAAVYAIVSTVLVHDWLAWNSARWQLGRDAVSNGMRPAQIEGGFEWNHQYAIEDGRLKIANRPAAGLVLQESANTFEGLSGDCGIAFTPIAGTTVIRQQRYVSWAGLETRAMLLVCLEQPPARR